MRHPFAALLLLGTASPSLAQSAATVDETAAPAEIIVTAQRRAERLLDVPVSVAVASGASLRELNLNAATDLQFVAPGLGLGDANTPRGAGFRVRGVGTNVFADGIEQSVGTVIDGVPLARAGQGLADLIDVERVEVLRGPQGMLFGRNASAGVINIVTRAPTEALSAEANASYGSGDELKLGATVSGPLGGAARARLTGFLNRQDGFVTNIRTGEKLNNRNEYGVRGALTFDAGEALDVTLRGDWSKRDNRANIWTIRALGAGSPIPAIAGPAVVADVGPRNDTVNLGGRVFNRIENYGGSVEANLRLDGVTLTSLTAYREWKQADNNDADQSPLNVLDVNIGTNDLYQLSQELRAATPADRPFSFVAGALYYRSVNRNLVDQVGRWAVPFAQATAAGIPLFGGLIQPSDVAGRQLPIRVDVRDLALFGQATLRLFDGFNLIGGARYTDTRVAAQWRRTAAPGTSPFYNSILGAPFAPLAYDLRVTDDNISWRAGAQFTPNRDTNLYVTVSRGYKGPGFDTQTDFTIPAGQTALQAALVRPELATNYEAGYKAALLNRRLNLSLAAYLTDFKDFQAQVFEVPLGSQLGSFRVRNAGKLRSKGFEAELTALPTEGLRVGVGVAYNDSEFRSFRGASCPRVAQATPGNVCSGGAAAFDASGLPATNAPRWTVSVNGRYDGAISDALGGFVALNLYSRSDASFAVVPAGVSNPYVQDAYVVVNGSVGVNALDGRVQLSLFARNLFDANYVTSVFDLPFGGAGDLGQFVTRDSRRTIGVQLGLRY